NIIDIMVLHQFVEVPAIAPLFSGSNRHSDHSPQLRDVLQESLGAHGIFDKIRREAFDQSASSYGVGQVEPLVEIDAPIASFADAVAGLRAVFQQLIHSFMRVESGI